MNTICHPIVTANSRTSPLLILLHQRSLDEWVVEFLIRRCSQLQLDPARVNQERLEYSDLSPLAKGGQTNAVLFVASLAAFHLLWVSENWFPKLRRVSFLVRTRAQQCDQSLQRWQALCSFKRLLCVSARSYKTGNRKNLIVFMDLKERMPSPGKRPALK